MKYSTIVCFLVQFIRIRCNDILLDEVINKFELPHIEIILQEFSDEKGVSVLFEELSSSIAHSDRDEEQLQAIEIIQKEANFTKLVANANLCDNVTLFNANIFFVLDSGNFS